MSTFTTSHVHQPPAPSHPDSSLPARPPCSPLHPHPTMSTFTTSHAHQPPAPSHPPLAIPTFTTSHPSSHPCPTSPAIITFIISHPFIHVHQPSSSSSTALYPPSPLTNHHFHQLCLWSKLYLDLLPQPAAPPIFIHATHHAHLPSPPSPTAFYPPAMSINPSPPLAIPPPLSLV